MFAYTLTPESVNLLIGGKPRTVHKSHINYAAVLGLLKDPGSARAPVVRDRLLLELIDVKSFIARVTEGRVQVSDDDVVFNGKKTHGVIRDRLLSHLAEGFDIHPLARFLDKLMDNPTESSRDDLYLWLEQSKMPICEDGDFLAYKYVRDDYTSVHDQKTLHKIGEPVSMPREECDTDRNSTCSRGLHFASHDYVCGSGSRHLIVKVNPRDVVAIPNDHNNAKGRACLYVVIGEVVKDEKAQLPPVVSAYGTYTKPILAEEFAYVPYPEDHVDPLGDHFDHQGCGCGSDEPGDPLDHNPCADIPPPTMMPRGKKPPATKLVFKHGDGQWSAQALRTAVEKHGQRGFAKRHGVPRSTLQGWLRTADTAAMAAKRNK